MKASECLAKYGDVAACKASGVDWVAAYAPRPGLRRNETHPIEVMDLVGTQAWRSRSELLGGDDWQPLLTAEEWQAKHPLRLRKLGEGEELVKGRHYVVRHKLAKWEFSTVKATHERTAGSNYEYFAIELLDLTAAESEPTEEAESPNVRDESGCPTELAVLRREWAALREEVKRLSMEPDPASNPVGERLTEPPEVGTPVVCFEDGKFLSVFPWLFGHLDSPGHTYYRYLGEIPQEPKEPEKVEPPKYAIRINYSPHTWQYWSCNTEHGAGWRSTLDRQTLFSAEELTDQLLTLAKNGWLPSQATVITVDGPELAALFAESEVGNG